MEHTHLFVRFIGIKVFGGRARAWVPRALVSGGTGAPVMYRCAFCRTQGYTVPA